MQDRLVSGRLVAALFEQGLAGFVTADLAARLAAEGIDLTHLSAKYPYEIWVRGLEITASELFGGEVLSDALRKLGSRVVKTLQASGLVKGPILTMGKLMGPKRVLKRISGQPVRGAAFLQIDVVEKGGKHLEVQLNDGALGDFFAGGLEAALEMLGARQPKVVALVTTPERCVLDVTWG